MKKDQTPQVNKDTLKEAIGKAEALDLTQYKEEGKQSLMRLFKMQRQFLKKQMQIRMKLIRQRLH